MVLRRWGGNIQKICFINGVDNVNCDHRTENLYTVSNLHYQLR